MRGMRVASLSALTLGLLLSGCGGAGGTTDRTNAGGNGQTGQAPVKGRYALIVSADAKQAADRRGIDLSTLASRALERVGRQLPGGTYPTVPVLVHTGTGKQTIPETGTNGFTNPTNGAIDITIDPVSKLGLARTLRRWLPSTIAHEAQNSARVVHGPGFGQTLLEWMVSEGLADVFSSAAFPATPTLPWTNALTADEEQRLWQQAQPSLNQPNSGSSRLYDRWFFGGGGIPRWAGYTIGTHIVEGYLARHRGARITEISLLPARQILAGSDYMPN